MTSKLDAREAFVWLWVQGETDPVVAGSNHETSSP